MRVLVEGSGGSAGWPEPGCQCASCLRQAAAGNVRKRSTIVVDGRLRLGAGTEAGEAGTGGAEAGAGYRVRRVPDLRVGGPGGWDVTGVDGGRLLYPAEPGAVPEPADGTAPYDVAFLDVLGDRRSSAGCGRGG